MFLARVLATLGLFAGSLPAQEGPRIELSTHELELGELGRGETTSGRIVIESTGDQPLEVHRIGVECKCAELTLEKNGIPVRIDARNQGRVDLILEPGERAEIGLHLDTENRSPGLSENHLLIFHDGPGSPERVIFRFTVRDEIGPRPDPPSGPAPRLRFGPEHQDLGRVLAGETPSSTFELENVGTAELHVETLRGQCKCLKLHLRCGDLVLGPDELAERSRNGDVLRLAPGERASLEVTVDTREIDASAQGDALRKGIRVRCDDPRRPESSVEVRADLVPSLQLVPVRARFAAVPKGEERVERVELRSEHLRGYQLADVVSTQPSLVWATFEELEGGEQPVYAIDVHFAARRLGSLQEALLLVVRHPTVTEAVLPVYAEVVPAVEFRVPGAPLPDRIEFGRLAVGESKELVLEVANLDPKVPYHLRDWAFVDEAVPEGIDVRVETVEEGLRYRIHVTVAATLDQRVFQAKLRLRAEHPDVPEKIVSVRGFRARES